MRENYSNLKRGIVLAAVLSSAFAKAQIIQTFSYTGTIETFTVPACVTSITIQAQGAEGGFSSSSSTGGGLGADMTGVFAVTSGQVLQILVGQQPLNNGGGGGSFVTDLTNNPWIVAGGGGGSCIGQDSQDKQGQTGTSGGVGAAGGGTGGTSGNGGNIGSAFAAGAGGGLLTDGQDGWTSGSGGKSFLNGGAAGTGGAAGGFGGGGSGSGYYVGGGGGGYSGGGGASNYANGSGGVGGGGGSYNGGTNQVNVGGSQSGNGQVIISYSANGLSVSASLSDSTGVCPGGSMTLNASSVVSYTWSTGAQATSISVSPSVTTSYTVSGTNSAGCVSKVTLTVPVKPVPSVSVAVTKALVCRGDTATFQALGASTYTWNNNSSLPYQPVSPITATSYSVIGTAVNGCTNMASAEISVDTLQFSSTPDTALCAGASILLSASGANAGTYAWTNNVNSSVNPFQTDQVTPSVSTIYAVTAVDANNCTLTRSVSVTINPNPTVTATASKTLVCMGEQVTLNGFGATTYSWSNGTGTQSIVISPTANIVVKVKGTDAGCSATYSISLKVDACTGIKTQQPSLPAFSVFPNPNNGLFTISVDKVEGVSAIKIYNVLGRLVKEQNLVSESSQIDLQNESSGVYFIYLVNSNGSTQTSRIIKE